MCPLKSVDSARLTAWSPSRIRAIPFTLGLVSSEGRILIQSPATLVQLPQPTQSPIRNPSLPERPLEPPRQASVGVDRAVRFPTLHRPASSFVSAFTAPRSPAR